MNNLDIVEEKGLGVKGAIIVASMFLFGDAALANNYISTKDLYKIAKVESSLRNGLKVKDTNGLFSYGMFQIQEPYLKDANRILGTKYTISDVQHKPDIALKVVKAYVNHYASVLHRKTKKRPELKQVIALHNGGPKGYKKSAALSYADKVIKSSLD